MAKDSRFSSEQHSPGKSGRPRILISACLLGKPVRYDGRGRSLPHEILSALTQIGELIPICPEMDGGLPCPREPAEIKGNKVLTRSGRDVTFAFRIGAQHAKDLCTRQKADFAVLKNKSPSCGFGLVYSGGFDGTLVPGNGLAAELLHGEGVEIFNEETVAEALASGLFRNKDKT